MQTLERTSVGISVGEPRFRLEVRMPRRYTALFLVGILFLLYLPALSGNYAFSDDYPFLWRELPQQVFVEIGRPLTGWFLKGCAGIVAITQGTNACHALGLLGVLGLGLATYRWARINRYPPLRALLLALLLLSVPSVPLYVTWINTTSSLYAALLATLALLVFSRVLFADQVSMRRWWGYTCLSGSLLVLAMFTYQPAALYYWSLAALALLGLEYSARKSFWQVSFPLVALGLASICVYFLLYKGALAFLGYATPARANWVVDYEGKLYWFLHAPLRNALALWTLVSASTHLLVRVVAGIIAAGALVDLLLACWRRWRRREATITVAGQEQAGLSPGATFLRWGLVLAFLPLSYAFNLAVEENWPSYRSLFALSATVMVLFVGSLDRLCALLPAARRLTACTAILVVCAVLAGYRCNAAMMDYMIVPQIVEYHALQAWLYSYDLSRVQRIHIVRPDGNEGVAPVCYYDEYGVPSLHAAWVPAAMVARALQHVGLDPQRYQVTDGTASQEMPSGPGTIVLDMRKLAWIRE